MIRYAVIVALVLSIDGCSTGEPAGNGRVVIDTTGNTITSLTSETAPSQLAKGPVVLLHDDRLYMPRSLAKNGDQLIIGDHTQLHLLRLGDRKLATVGRQGEGPGEFQSVVAVAGTPSGDILVLDERQGRLTVLDSAGVYKSSQQLKSLDMLRVPRSNVLTAFQDGVILAWGAGVVNPNGEPFDVAVVWQGYSGQLEEIARLKDVEMVDGGRMIIPRNPYGARPLVAVGPGGAVATSDGLDYCVTIRKVGASTVRRLCREWERLPAESDPSVSRLRSMVHVKELSEVALEARLGNEELDIRNSIEGMLLDSSGNLWVQVLQPDTRYSIMIRYSWSELRPEYYTWDVFSPSGHRLAEVLFPNRFVPLLIDGQHVYGTLELDTGELVIAQFEVELPKLGRGMEVSTPYAVFKVGKPKKQRAKKATGRREARAAD